MYGSAGEGWGGLGRAGEAPGRCFDVRLRIYGFTDLTPSLPLRLADLFTVAEWRAAIARSETEKSAAHLHEVVGAAGRSESPRARRDEGDSEKWKRCRNCGVA